MIVHDVVQGSPEWVKLRIGIPTSSEMHLICTPANGDLSKSWKAYAARLIWEKLLNTTTINLDGIEHIENGKVQEPYAVRQFEMMNDVETEAVGFVTTDDGTMGSSPDRLIKGQSATLEVKAPTGVVHMQRLLFGHGTDYRPQVQHQLLVCERDKAIFYSYVDRAPPYQIETGRDEPYLRKMRAALREFDDNLQLLTEKALSMGAFQAYEDLVLPLEREHGPEMRKGMPVPDDARTDWAMSG